MSYYQFHRALGQDKPSAEERLREMRCTSYGGKYIGAGLCDYTEECAEQGMDWVGDVEPSGRPICVRRPQPTPGGAPPPKSPPAKPSTAAAALPGALLIGAIYYVGKLLL
jgi:hypothetical protein